MIQQMNTANLRVYQQMNTNNKSFLDMHHFLKAKGIKNNAFFLNTFDPDLLGIDPRDPNLSGTMKTKVLREIMFNYWYFLREVVRIPDQGGAKGGGVKYQLHRGNLAMNFCLAFNYNIFAEFPRQQGKTAGIICRMLWEYQFGSTNSESIFINKKHDDSKMNLQRMKDYRDALPSYLHMTEVYDASGKKLKAENRAESILNPNNNNRIRTLPAARNKIAANSLGRGMTIPRIWYDEYAFIPHNGTIYLSATPAFKTASLNAKRNHSPYGIIITTTPGDLTTEEGLEAYQTKEDATKFDESWYDLSKKEIDDIVALNTNSPFVYIRFTYQQLGKDEQWFKEMVVEMKRQWSDIRREVLLEWAKSSANSPFVREDLDKVKTYVREPIRRLSVYKNAYVFDIFEDMDLRYPPIIGVDVSGGYQRDSSAITIIDSRTTRIAATFNCNFISTIDLASVIYELVTRYMPNAIVNVERNGGFGASVLAKLVKSSIKKNLYYEIKDKVIEETFDGMNRTKKTKRVKVFGLDSTKDVRDSLMEILRERMELHKDKFVSPIIYNELEGLEVKRNGKIEHASTGHDDQIFSYLMALYVWYEGKEVMERYGIRKESLKTDEDEEDSIVSLEEKYENIMEELEIPEETTAQVKEQLEILNKKSLSYEEWMKSEYNKDQQAMKELMRNKDARKAYAKQFHTDEDMLNDGRYTISDEVFRNFND